MDTFCAFVQSANSLHTSSSSFLCARPSVSSSHYQKLPFPTAAARSFRTIVIHAQKTSTYNKTTPSLSPDNNNNNNHQINQVTAQKVVTQHPTTTPPHTKSSSKKNGANLGTIIALGLSHHTASVDLRERLAVPEDQWTSVAKELVDAVEEVREAAILSTCNRFEIFLVVDDDAVQSSVFGVQQFLVTRMMNHTNLVQNNTRSSTTTTTTAQELSVLRNGLFLLQGDAAIFHLLRVAAGLDSLVVGEGQILAQVKRCYDLSTMKNGGVNAQGDLLIPGSAGKILTRLLNTAVSAGKRIRTETQISKGAVSISSAAVELAEMIHGQDLGIDTDSASSFAQVKVAIIGAGTMSKLLVQHLTAKGVRDIVLVNRSMERANDLALQFPDCDITIKPLTSLYEVVTNAQLVFTSTSAKLPILNKENVAPLLDASSSWRIRRGQKLMLIDISVPRNVDENVKELIDQVAAYNVDDLKVVVAKNQARRKRLILEAENMLRDELVQFNHWYHSLNCVPAITKLQQRAETIRLEELERFMGKLDGITPQEKEAIHRLSKGIINKMLHGPMAHLRALQDMDEVASTLKSLESLFNI